MPKYLISRILKSLLLAQLAFFISCNSSNNQREAEPQTEKKNNSDWLIEAQKLESKNKIKPLLELVKHELSIDSNNTDALLYFSKIQIYLGKYQLAFDYINKALKKDRYLEEGYFQKGIIYKYIGDTALAISSYYTVTEINAKNAKAWMELGLLHIHQNSDKSLPFLNRALENGYDSSEVFFAKGWYEQKQEKWKEAKDMYIIATESSPAIPAIFYNLGFVEAKLGHFENAIDILNEGKYRFPAYTKFDTLILELYHFQTASQSSNP
jgi:tetratricopeptide (TPR) repeat protein